MPKIEDTIEVQVPVQQAYNQWTQFEDFPKFMEGIQSVQQLDDTHVQWVAEIGGESRQWTTEITVRARRRRGVCCARQRADGCRK